MAAESAEVVVVGGGVIGAATAYYLAAQKVSVALLERAGLAGGTSGACEGSILMQTKRPGLHLECARQSSGMYAALSDELETDLEYSRHGSMMIAETELELEHLVSHAEQQRRAGVPIEVIDANAVRERQPALGDHVLSATVCHMDAEVNPYRVALAFAAAARRKGASIHQYTCVTGIRQSGSRITDVETDSGTISTNTVVNAAGVWAPALAQMVGVTVPIRPRRGMILVTEPRERILKGTVLSAEYLTSKFPQGHPSERRPPEEQLSGGLVMGQTKSGNVLIGSSRQFVGYDSRVTREGIAHISARAVRAMPLLRTVSVIRTYAGLRPATPDGLPILGRIPGVEGFVMAAGHEGDGIALAPWTGRSVAELILGRTRPEQLAGLELRRFAIEPVS
jgi:glycine/D-amino acid oxidase-like deaminating enzyme